MIKKRNRNQTDFIHGESFPEGIMFNDNKKLSISIRNEDGKIENKVICRSSFLNKHKSFDFFVVRGFINFIEGSVNQFLAGRYIKELKKNAAIEKKQNFHLSDAFLYLSVMLTILAGFIIYFLFPTTISFFLKKYIGNIYVLYGIEIIIRVDILIFIFYLLNKTKNAQKTAFYHGAEHKVIQCYETGEEITLDQVKKQSIYSPNCGTSFLFLLIIISIPAFLFLNYENLWIRLGIMLLLLPILIGISFDITEWIGKTTSATGKKLSKIGLSLQKLNAKTPDDEHLEIAINALKHLINNDPC